MNKVDVVKLRSVKIRDADYFGWTITCFDDVTEIQYYEQEDGKSVIKHTYNFTAGYDVEIFKEALKLRAEYEKEIQV